MAIEGNLRSRDFPGSLKPPILASQYFGARHEQAPERRLMVAILHDAFDCIEKFRTATDKFGQQVFQEAARWFLAEEADWPFCFEQICAGLDLDPNAVRQRLRVTQELNRVAESRARVRRRKLRASSSRSQRTPLHLDEAP